MMQALALALLLLAILSQSFIDLELAADLGPWQANAPIADLAALGLLPLAVLGWLRGQRLPLPGLPGYLLLLLAALLSLPDDPNLAANSAHTLLRKPIFLYVAYAFGLAWAARHVASLRVLTGGILAWALLTALISLLTSGSRILAGDALWFQQIAGLTPNHKTLALGLAGGLPFLLARWPGGGGLLGLVLLAIVLSASKTAWLMAILAVGLFYPAHRPLVWRWRISLPAAILATALAYAAPFLVDSRAMLDAMHSRQSLDLRAWLLFSASPLTGAGMGMSTVFELGTYPHYRVNGVDAHGVIQKIGAELGLVGLAGYAAFTAATGSALYRRWRMAPEAYAPLAVWAVNTAGLLLSTETFSQTWWLPLGLAWGMAHHPPPTTPPTTPPPPDQK